jgi:hypothetical protein
LARSSSSEVASAGSWFMIDALIAWQEKSANVYLVHA